jgi:hypothetical protein
MRKGHIRRILEAEFDQERELCVLLKIPSASQLLECYFEIWECSQEMVYIPNMRHAASFPHRFIFSPSRPVVTAALPQFDNLVEQHAHDFSSRLTPAFFVFDYRAHSLT